MDKRKVILLTGAAGFIGSYLLGFLNKQGFKNVIIVDDFSENEKKPNYESKFFIEKVEREKLFEWLKSNNPVIDYVLHIGARTDTTEFDYSIHEKLNVEYSKKIWEYCTEKNLPAGRQGIPLIYASSAATYGSGELGYKDDHDLVENLRPLNPYGVSKNEFDKWALKETRTPLRGEGGPPFWAGLKFFNVYGPNEYHKARMASVIFHSFNQIKALGKVKLFRSHKPEYKDGEQLRDFIYVEDVCKVIFWMMKEAGSQNPIAIGSEVRHQTSDIRHLTPGLYNLGTGKARTFNDLVFAIYTSLQIVPVIEYIDTPEDIRDKYQYFTEADMNKIRDAGYNKEFYSLEEGVKEYVTGFLANKKYY